MPVVYKDLKYEEKFIGSLTMRQSLYVAFLTLIGVYVLAYTQLSVYAKLGVVFLLFVVGASLVFLRLDERISKNLRYRLGKRTLSWLSPEMRDFFGVENISHDSVFLADGRILGVVRVIPLDFLILEETERDKIIAGFRRFLNSLNFPTQIVMRSVELDIEGHLSHLQDTVRESKDEFKMSYFRQYASFLRDIIDINMVSDREYYVITPSTGSGSIENKLGSLDTDVERVIHSLSSAGISSSRLNTQQLFDLYSNFFAQQYKVGMEYYSPLTLYARMRELDEVDGIMRDEIKKNLKEGHPLYSERYEELVGEYGIDKALFKGDERDFARILVTPDLVKISEREVLISKYHRVLFGANYPREVTAGWLSELVSMKADLNISIHILPYSKKLASNMLNNQIKKLASDIYALESAGKLVNQSDIIQREDLTALLKQIEAGSEKFFDMGFYVDVKAHDLKSLDENEKKVRNVMESISFTPKLPALEMKEALQSCLPICSDKLGGRIDRSMTSSSVAACFPFVTSSLEDASGVLIGFNQLNQIPIILDPFKHPNHNILVLGTSGGGKSFMIKLIAMREYMAGTEVYIIDPQGEYTDMVKALDGDVVKISPDSDTVINPLDMMDLSYDDKKLSLYSFFTVLIGDEEGQLKEPQRACLDDVLDQVYEQAGITHDPTTWNNKPPTLQDLYDALEPKLKDPFDMIRMPALAIHNRLKIYVDGPLRFLNKDTSVNLRKKLICFDISDIEEGKGKRTVLYLVLEYLYKKMKKSKTRKMIIVDEAWSVLNAATSEDDFITRIVKTSRKFNLSLCMISQEVKDFLSFIPHTNIPRGESVFANTAIKLLLKQDVSVIKQIVGYFNLSDAEKNYLLQASPGDVLMLMQSGKVPVRIVSSDEETVLITTSPEEEEKFKIAREKAAHEKEFKLDDPVHLKDDLTEQQIRALNARRFTEILDPGLRREASKMYLIKNTSNESDTHFIVQHLLADLIREYARLCGMDEHKLDLKVHPHMFPDLTFHSVDNKFVAVEVVDESDFINPSPSFRAKIENLKSEDSGYDEWFMVALTHNVVDEASKVHDVFLRTEVATVLKKYFKVK